MSTMNNMNIDHGEGDGEDEFPTYFVDFDWEDNRQNDVDNERDELDYNLMCTIINSPGGRPSFWIPIVGTHAEIDKECNFDTLEEGVDAYYQYAKHAGFDTRLGSEKTKKGVLQFKYVFCNRAVDAKKYNVDTSNGEKGKQQQKKASHMSKSPAKIYFKVLDDGSFRYGVNKLEVMHNHELYTNTTMHMAKHKRKLDFFYMTLINQLSQKNIGARLRTLADNVAKCNYKEFSDIVLFNATYHTIKYNLVFVPFTGVDNHKKCITLGGGLLARGTSEYYTWLLKQFLDAFGKQPVIVVTDQEAAVDVAVEKAMDKQRRIQSENDFNSTSKKLSLESKLAVEVQASHFYTHAVMRIFQKEIHDCVYACSPGPIVSHLDHDSYLVVEEISGVADCISIIAHDTDAMKSFIKSQKEIRKKIVEKPPEKDTRSRAEKLARTLGVPTTLSNDIRNPENVKNKGRVSGKRMRSQIEVAFSRSSKGSKTCSYYRKKVEPNEKHDRRTCPQRKEDEAHKNMEEDMDGMFDSR
ncbi:hypothetical protein LXL04_034064 [Taraxacum kok-saghyz]